LAIDTATETLIVVDGDDREIATAEKLDAHRRGLLHRAFSVIVWGADGRQLLQKRAVGKYHSGGLWTNACCGHPRPGEQAGAAALRRLGEEMGFCCALEMIGAVRYRAAFDNGLVENEIVHVFRGRYDGRIVPSPVEVEGYQWCSMADIRGAIAAEPSCFSVWFRQYIAEEWPMALAPSPAAPVLGADRPQG